MLSELENIVLGVVNVDQPCSAYRVRMVFADSPSRHWSGSAGSIYPLVGRLESGGLLQSVSKPGDGRATRLYRLTRRGRSRLLSWLRPPLPDGGDLMTMDPLRVRVRFMEALRPEERLAALEDAEAKLREKLTSIEREVRHDKREGDTFRYLSGRGAVRSLRAQLDWLREVRIVLGFDR